MLHQYTTIDVNAEPKLLKIWCSDSSKKIEALKQKTKVDTYKQNNVKKI